MGFFLLFSRLPCAAISWGPGFSGMLLCEAALILSYFEEIDKWKIQKKEINNKIYRMIPSLYAHHA